MAMTAFYMGAGASKRKHGEAHIERVDKNGTEHWLDHNCPKCGGSGYLPGYEFIDGARCWKCGATGYHPHRWTKQTPEYAAKLAAKRDERARKKNLEGRADFLEKEGFNSEGKTFVVAGNTFDIKDEFKAAGAKYCAPLGWHFAEKPENLITIEMSVEECFWENNIATLNWNETYDIQEIIKARTPREPSISEYLGKIGERITVRVALKKSFSFENDYGYRPTTSYIHNFEDEAGNVIIWKTTKSLNEYTYSAGGYTVHELIKCDLTGTVKEHSEYKGIKQTILTRCKIENKEQS